MSKAETHDITGDVAEQLPEDLNHPHVIQMRQQSETTEDVTLRLQIIATMHNMGEHGQRDEAIRSLRNAYPRFFRDDL